MGKYATHQIILLRAPSNQILNISRCMESTTSLDSLFHWLTTLTVKNNFLTSNLNLTSNFSEALAPWLVLESWRQQRRPEQGRRKDQTLETEAIWNLKKANAWYKIIFSRLSNCVYTAGHYFTCMDKLEPWTHMQLSTLPAHSSKCFQSSFQSALWPVNKFVRPSAIWDVSVAYPNVPT